MIRILLLLISFIGNCGADVVQMDKSANSQEAIFAMGCFWCGAAAFSDHDTNIKYPGILSVKAGYTGGSSTNPTYPDHEGHQEAVKVIFDPEIIPYEKILEIFWHNIDPFDDKGQFCDKGKSYRAAVYYKDADQKAKALASKEKYEKTLGCPLVTDIKEASPFYEAEEEHQDYKAKNPIRYKVYRWNCGRDQRLKEVWGKE